MRFLFSYLALAFLALTVSAQHKAFAVAFEKQRDGIVFFANSANGLLILREILADALGGKHPAAWANPGKLDSPARVLLKALATGGAEKALSDYRRRRETSLAERLSGSRINSIGYDLLRMQKIDEAIAVFKLNAEDFPNSANVWDSLAEAQLLSGDIPQALANYKKSLALDPSNTGAAAKIKQLEL